MGLFLICPKCQARVPIQSQNCPSCGADLKNLPLKDRRYFLGRLEEAGTVPAAEPSPPPVSEAPPAEVKTDKEASPPKEPEVPEEAEKGTKKRRRTRKKKQ